MSDKSKIEWTDATWNPMRGCSQVSPGCLPCYAETLAEHFRGVPGYPFEFCFDLRMVPEKFGDPLWWSAARKLFENSMSELFHEKPRDEHIVKVAHLMKAKLAFGAEQPQIWQAVRVKKRQQGLPRTDLLFNSPAQPIQRV